jgi:putative dehydrogenase
MTLTVAVIAPGMMGSGVASRLTQNGVRVITALAGRNGASVARAAAAGMQDAPDAEIAAADIILSIVPPGSAIALAQRLAPHLKAAAKKPVYADCNAVSPQTVEMIAAVIAATGAPFVDGGIIGGPPKPGSTGTQIYISGPNAPALAILAEHGLEIRLLTGPIGAASALKMSYAGITKGFTALGTAMVLAATRAGAADDLARELAASQPALLAWLSRGVPRMYSKTYRWVAEMEEIATFTGIGDPAAAQIFKGAADLYTRIAADFDADRQEINALDAFLAPKTTRLGV